jgi:hypothetical protein
LLVAGLLLAGCAAYPVPTEQFAASESAIAAAVKAGAAELAADDIKSAQEKLQLAKRWIAAKDYQPAQWLVEQAHVDAELAEMKAMSARARKVAAQMTAEYRAKNVLVLAATLGLGGCAFVPKDYPRLDEARAQRTAAQSNPDIARLSPAELRTADEVLDRAGNARNTLDDPAVVDHLAYLAKQRLAIAREAAELRVAQQTIQQIAALR